MGSAVATSIALPMVLYQITRTRADGEQPAQEPTGTARDNNNVAVHPVGLGRRVAGIVLAAVTIPAVVAVTIVMQQVGAAWGSSPESRSPSFWASGAIYSPGPRRQAAWRRRC